MYLYLLLALIPAYALAEDVCPPDNFSEVCVCDRGTVFRNSDISCTYVDDQDKIVKTVKDTKGYAYDDILVEVSRMDCFPTSIFGEHVFKSGRVYDTALQRLFCEQSPRSDDLEEFECIDSKISERVPANAFEGFTKLRNLTGYKMNLGGAEILEKLPRSIERVKLLECGINQLTERVFADYSEMLELKVEGDNFEEVQRSMFPHDSKLQIMSFAHNKIREIPSDLFNSMNIKQVNFTGNQISTLEKDTIRPVVNKDDSEFADFSDNPIKCECGLSWIADLDDRQRSKIKGTCEIPKVLHGTLLKDLKSDNFQGC